MSKNDDGRAAAILDAAAALISHYGYGKTTVGDIAERARISKGAVYLEFGGKDELVTALLLRESRRLMGDILRRVEADPEGGRISGIYRHGVKAVAANPLMRALYTRDSRTLGDAARRQPPEFYSERFLLGRKLFARMQDAGLLRADLTADAIAFQLAIISSGLMTVEAPSPGDDAPPLEQVADDLADLVERGLGAPDGDPAAGKRALADYIADVERQQSQLPQAPSDAEPRAERDSR